jgi:hypothetical protein
VDRAHSSKTSRPPTPKDQLPGDNQHRAKPPGDNGNRRLSGN